jgi:hypothetical protein
MEIKRQRNVIKIQALQKENLANTLANCSQNKKNKPNYYKNELQGSVGAAFSSSTGVGDIE